MNQHCGIMAIQQDNRTETAVKVQDILTKYGCEIRARLGLREGYPDQCSDKGLIILQLCGTEEEQLKMKKELDVIEKVKVKYMDISNF
ncbi:MAG: hypothetical protein ACLFQV_12950 [Vulcanimicrobiota bacterium]